MGKHGETKERITELIASGNDTLSGISAALGIAPSTVSKHLYDLEHAGIIEMIVDQHVRKWKHYRLNNGGAKSNGDGTIGKDRSTFAATRYWLAVAVMSLVAVSIYVYITSSTGAATSYFVPISLTDPPHVPYGTQSLYINYSSLSLRVVNGSGSEWVRTNSSGRLDLLGLINVSQVIGGVNLYKDSEVDAVAFDINSANITVDGMTYNVTVLGRNVVKELDNPVRINASSGVLIDFSPVVDAFYTPNSTEFTLSPSVKTLIANTGGQRFVAVGMRFPIAPTMINAFWNNTGTLGVKGANFGLTSNVTTFNVTLINYGVAPLIIRSVTLLPGSNDNAPLSIRTTWGPFPAGINTSLVSIRAAANGTQNSSMVVGTSRFWRISSGNATYPRMIIYNGTPGNLIVLNASAIYRLGEYGTNAIKITLPNGTRNITITGFGGIRNYGIFLVHPPMPIYFDELTFVANANGTLSAPMTRAMFAEMIARGGFGGYELGPNSTATLTYVGHLGFGNMEIPQGPFENGTYRVVVTTSNGLIAVWQASNRTS